MSGAPANGHFSVILPTYFQTGVHVSLGEEGKTGVNLREINREERRWCERKAEPGCRNSWRMHRSTQHQVASSSKDLGGREQHVESFKEHNAARHG